MNASLAWSQVVPSWSTEDIVGWVKAVQRRDDNIIGLGFGYKTIGGEATEVLAAVVIVRRKLPEGDAGIGYAVPAKLNGMPTDVVQGGPRLPATGEELASSERTHRGGGRVDIDKRPWGTFGCTVTMVDDTGATRRSVLSNAHVMVPPRPLVPPVESGRRPGVASPNEPITVYDNHKLARRRQAIATLSRYVPLVPKERGYNLLDGACAAVTSETVKPGIAGVGTVKSALSREELGLGTRVRKTGAASKRPSTGFVRLVRTAYRIRTGDYGLAGTGSDFVFAEQVVAEVHQQGGDSGSVLVDEEGRAVGLVHARHPEGWAIAAPAWTVESELGVRFGDDELVDAQEATAA